MTPIKTSEQLPEQCIQDGSEQVWWWDSYDDCWRLGIALFMDFDNPTVLGRYTHWLPEEAITIPEESQ